VLARTTSRDIHGKVWLARRARSPIQSWWRARRDGPKYIQVFEAASALVGRLKLWTVDPRLAMLAKELGIAYS
jgi:hypothetical protein